MSYALAMEVKCQRTARAREKWQQQTHSAILQAYQKKRSEYEERLAALQAQVGVQISGRHPQANRMLERDEIKKWCVTLPKIKNAGDVAFLTFEGGGGKGVTYVGAIRALEELGILPIPYVTQGLRDDTRYESILIGPDLKFVLDGDHLQKQNAKIEGVSGASAGAITALLITLGHSALSLWSLLKRRHDFEALYDAPFPGLLRGVVANQPVRVFNRNLGVKDEAGREQVVRRRVQSEIPVLYGIIPFAAALTFGEVKQRASRLSFSQLKTLTGIDLVVTGTNITARQVAYFSPKLTPDFPVVEAVCISSFGVKVQPFDEIKDYAADLLETLLFPSERGQLRTTAEQEQTIELDTFDLETTDFAPARDKLEQPIKAAYEKVRNYFRR